MKGIFRTVVVWTNLFMVYVISEQELAVFRPASIIMETKIYSLFLNINQLGALNFIISLFQASTCLVHQVY